MKIWRSLAFFAFVFISMFSFADMCQAQDKTTRLNAADSAFRSGQFVVDSLFRYLNYRDSIYIVSDIVDRVKAFRGRVDTIILTNGYHGRPITTRFIVDGDHYREAATACQLSQIPYQGLNEMGRRQLEATRKYILREEAVESTAHKKNKK